MDLSFTGLATGPAGGLAGDQGGRGGRVWLPYALLLGITFALYSATIFFPFQWDDIPYVVSNPLIQALPREGWRVIWANSYLGHYAPLHISLLALIGNLAGMRAEYFHVAQLLLHGACVCLLYLLLKKLCSPGVAFLSALLFVVHPTNVETVAWIAETKSTLAFLFFLLAYLALLRLEESGKPADGVLMILLLALSLLAKINTVVAPGIFLLHCWRRRTLAGGIMRRTLAAGFVLSALFVAIHLASFFNSASTFAKSNLEGSYVGGLGTHLMHLPFLLGFYLRMLIYPEPLTVWHMFLLRAALDWQVIAAWLALLAVAALLLRASREVIFWAAWFVAFLAPVLQIIPNLTWVAERYLYIPAIGVFVLFARGAEELRRRWLGESRPALLPAATAALAVVFSVLTLRHVPAFRSGFALWESALPTCMESAQCHAGYGEELLVQGKVEAGMKELIQAVNIRPSAVWLEKLGDGFALHARDFAQAGVAYQMALDQSPDSVELQLKRLRTLIQGGKLQQAEQALQPLLAATKPYPMVLLAESVLRWKQADMPAARSAYARFLAAVGITSPSPRLLIGLWGNGAEIGAFQRALRG